MSGGLLPPRACTLVTGDDRSSNDFPFSATDPLGLEELPCGWARLRQSQYWRWS